MARYTLKSWRTAYKLTDANGRTHNGCQWGKGVTNPHGKRSGEGGLCGDGFYHAYVTPEVADLMNPIHANIANPLLWRIEVRGIVEEDGEGGILKLGATEMRSLHTVPFPRLTTEQRVRASIYIAGTLLDDAALDIPEWREWADNHLGGIASLSAAWSAAESARSAAWSAARSAAWSAARSAAWSSEAAAWSAEAAAAARSAILLDAYAFAKESGE